MADAASMLAQRWTLVTTNVPFLGYRDMAPELVSWLTANHAPTKGDLGYCLWRRFLRMLPPGGAVAIVSLQHWRSAISYKDFRREILSQESVELVGYLGVGAFREISGSKVNITLTICRASPPDNHQRSSVFDCSASSGTDDKAITIRSAQITQIAQRKQIANPAHTFLFHESENARTLSEYAWCLAGVMNGDTPRFTANFWEVDSIRPLWAYLQSTTDGKSFVGGFYKIIYYDEESGHLREDAKIRRERLHNSDERGNQVWGKNGIAVNQMADLSVNYYFGDKYDSNVAVICAKDAVHTPAIVAYCSSNDFLIEIRKIEQKLNITNATFGRMPFDLHYWQARASQSPMARIPDPYSDDPTQWFFHGNPRYASRGTELHVALARLAGYRWPAETDTAMRLSTEARARIAEAASLPAADADGLLPLTPLLGERALADRLRAFCIAAWGAEWQPSTEATLVAAACDLANERRPAALTLDAWLRTHAARQHAKLFHDRPFLWWITDGRADGFTAIAHYHRLTKDKLERLAFQMLGDHLTRLGEDPRAEAARILQRKLERIIEGEAPFDIFVRWKPLHAQPIGWEPDLDDGVRLNIRPFIEAGVLAHVPNVRYTVDRGKDVASAPWYGVFGGERRNDHHTTLAEKREVRAKAKP